VRLEFEYGTISEKYSAAFQFHKGAIGVSIFVNLSSVLKYFNSIKVRLEFVAKLAPNVFEMVFQFHKGAIGVSLKTHFITSGNKFQFHKGAIGVI